MKRIQKKDRVYILSGNHKGKKGIVEKVKKDKVWITRVQMVTRHQRNPQEPGKGLKINKTVPFHISKIALLNPDTGKQDKIRFERIESAQGSKKARVFKSNHKLVP